MRYGEALKVRKFGDAVNLGQAMRCLVINVAWRAADYSNNPQVSTSAVDVN